MSGSDALMRRMRKIMALANEGAPGEREAAKRHLDSLCKKHGITLEQLSDESEATQDYEFIYLNEYERKLLVQCASLVLDSCEIETSRYRGTRNRLLISLTKGQSARLHLIYDTMRAELRKEFELATKAFIQVNHLYPESSDDKEPRKLTPEELSELRKMVARMGSMERVNMVPAIELKPAAKAEYRGCA